MNEKLGLRLLGEIMHWPDEEARREFQWLRLMARIKYDTYDDFRAGARFLERLAVWLQQFEPGDRESAYRFIKDRLVYIGPAEMQLLVERFYPTVVERDPIHTVSKKLRIPPFLIWQDPASIEELKLTRRRALFMALSDGARIDELRRANVGVLSNEQIVVATQLDKTKWLDLFRKLRKKQGPTAKFDSIYLIDDFIASGTTLLRYEDQARQWEGKILKFHETLALAQQALGDESILSNMPVHIHHYVATALASKIITERVAKLRAEDSSAAWLDDLSFSFGYVLPPDIVVDKHSADPFKEVIEKYYDPIIETEHSEVSGVRSMMYGYKECGLPLVLEHNTPNNSIPLLWAETKGDLSQRVHPMRPLFRRRQRHS